MSKINSIKRPEDRTRCATLASFFERVFVVNLDCRRERMRQFLADLPVDWPFKPPHRFAAINGKLVTRPHWYHESNGAWGCYRSHLRILEDCLNEGIESALILEDDARCVPDFAQRVCEFVAMVPGDWQMIYLGGEHYYGASHPPLRVNDQVYQVYNANRTHAYAYRGREFMQQLYRFLLEPSRWHHIDQNLGRLHETRQYKVYCPSEWLIAQAGGISDTSGCPQPEFIWQSAIEAGTRPEGVLFVAVLGLRHSGSSIVAKWLHESGVHLGREFTQLDGPNSPQEPKYEGLVLGRISEEIAPFPTTEIRLSDDAIRKRLYAWIDNRRRDGVGVGSFGGGHSPIFCRLGSTLLQALGNDLRVIVVERDLVACLEDLAGQYPRIERRLLAKHQEWLLNGLGEFLNMVSQEAVVRIRQSQLVNDPNSTREQIANFLRLNSRVTNLT